MLGIPVCWFYILQLYYIHWLALVIFWWCLQGFLSRGLCYVQTMRVFLFLHCFSFSFSSLIAVARISKTLLNNSGKSRHHWLVPDIRGNAFRFSQLRIMFAVVSIVLKLDSVSHLTLLFSFNTVLVILQLLLLHINFRIGLLISIK